MTSNNHDEAKQWKPQGTSVVVTGQLPNAPSAQAAMDKILSPSTWKKWRTQKGISAKLRGPNTAEPLKDGNEFMFGIGGMSFVIHVKQVATTTEKVLVAETESAAWCGILNVSIHFEIWTEKVNGKEVVKAKFMENQAGWIKPPAKEMIAANELMIKDLNDSFAK